MKKFKNLKLLTCFILLQAAAITASAQDAKEILIPMCPNCKMVGSEFSGEWFFYKAQAQERKMGSVRKYSVRSVSQDEFWQKAYFLNMPTQIMLNGFFARISHPSWSKHVVSIMNGGKLEFRTFQEGREDFNKRPDINEIGSYPTMMPVYDLALDGGVMSLKSEYFYSDGKGNYTEGVLTIFYKKQ